MVATLPRAQIPRQSYCDTCCSPLLLDIFQLVLSRCFCRSPLTSFSLLLRPPRNSILPELLYTNRHGVPGPVTWKQYFLKHCILEKPQEKPPPHRWQYVFTTHIFSLILPASIIKVVRWTLESRALRASGLTHRARDNVPVPDERTDGFSAAGCDRLSSLSVKMGKVMSVQCFPLLFL